MIDTPTCPHCGYDLRKDEPLFTDLWFMDPRGIVIYREQLLHFSAQEFAFLWALFKNKGRPVSGEAMTNRISDSICVSLSAVIACRLRRRFKNYGIPCPFSHAALGWRWDRDLAESLTGT